MLLAIAGWIGGCAKNGTGDGEFSSVAAISRDRLGQQLQWQRSPADSEGIAGADCLTK
jgi:hypothetical protein